jgi:hypothetical protein
VLLCRANAASYKRSYSPVSNSSLTYGAQVTEAANPYTGSSSSGCTWPGANNYQPGKKYDDGSCTCAANQQTWNVSTDGYYRTYESYVTRLRRAVVVKSVPLTRRCLVNCRAA